MSILIKGDTHLGKGVSLGKSGIAFSLNSRIKDQVDLLNYTTYECLQNNVTDLFLTGDIFEDPKPSTLLMELFIVWLKDLSVHNINTHIIIGNHECVRSGNYYSSPLDIISHLEIDNIHIHKNIDTIHLNGFSVTVLPFRDKRSFDVSSNEEAIKKLKKILEYEISSIPLSYKKILIGHMAYEGSIPIGDEISDMTNELFLTKDILKDYDYCWLGHIHRNMVMNKSNPYIEHIGSMDLSDFSEEDQTKYLINYDVSNNKFKHIKLPTRPLRKLTINVPPNVISTDYVIDELSKVNNLKKAIVKLEVILSSQDLLPIDRQKIEKCLYDKEAFYISKIIETKKAASIKQKIDSIKDNTIDTEYAIKLYAESFIDEKDRSEFMDLAKNISKEVQL